MNITLIKSSIGSEIVNAIKTKSKIEAVMYNANQDYKYFKSSMNNFDFSEMVPDAKEHLTNKLFYEAYKPLKEIKPLVETYKGLYMEDYFKLLLSIERELNI